MVVHRRRHGRHPQPRHRRRRRRPGRDDPLRPPRRPPHRDVTASSSRTATAPTAVYRVDRRAVLRLQQRPLHPVRLRRRPRPASSSTCPPSHVWDASTVASLDAITTKYERKGKTVEIIGLDASSAERHERLPGSLPCTEAGAPRRDGGARWRSVLARAAQAPGLEAGVALDRDAAQPLEPVRRGPSVSCPSAPGSGSGGASPGVSVDRERGVGPSDSSRRRRARRASPGRRPRCRAGPPR